VPSLQTHGCSCSLKGHCNIQFSEAHSVEKEYDLLIRHEIPGILSINTVIADHIIDISMFNPYKQFQN